jgi:hypothetical protein
MASAAKEIVYEETASGVFAPAPTRAQKRAAKREAELKAKKREEWVEIVGATLLILVVTGVGMIPFIRWH